VYRLSIKLDDHIVITQQAEDKEDVEYKISTIQYDGLYNKENGYTVWYPPRRIMEVHIEEEHVKLRK